MLHAAAVLAALLLAAPHVSAQETKILEVLGADRLSGSAVGGMEFRELTGNVSLRQGNVRIRCQRAVQNITANMVDLSGDVVIIQDTLILKTQAGSYDANTRVASTGSGVYLFDGHVTLTADAGSYDAERRLAHFRSRVALVDSSARIRAARLRYERDSGRVIAEDSVFIRLRTERAAVIADSVVHYPDLRRSYFYRNPLFAQIDTARVTPDTAKGESPADTLRLDTLTITAREMRILRDSGDVFLAEGGTEITRGALAARCEQALFARRDSLIILRTDPVLWYEDTQASGDSIAVHVAGSRLRALDIVGAAFTLSQSKPAESDSMGPPGRYDQTQGKRIGMDFTDGEIRAVTVEGNAISVYYLYDDRALNGVRRESGDRMVIGFDGRRAAEIRTSGGVEGTYYPEKFVSGVEATYNIEGFRLRADRPRRPALPPALLAE